MSQKQTHNRPRSVGEGRVEVGARSVEGEGTQPVDQLVELPGAAPGCIDPRKVKGQPAALTWKSSEKITDDSKPETEIGLSAGSDTQRLSLHPVDVAVAHPAPGCSP